MSGSNGSNGNGEYDTPAVLQRPVVNPANRAAVMVLHNLALTLEATPRALVDIAKTIQLSSEPLSPSLGKRIADVITEHAGNALRGAQALKEATEAT